MRIDLDALAYIATEAKAKQAGPWTVEWTYDPGAEPRAERSVNHVLDANGRYVLTADSGVYEPHGFVAEHIAANNPDVTLVLIDRIRRLEEELARASGVARSHGADAYADDFMAVAMDREVFP